METGMGEQTFISAQLRESAPYLNDAGFRQTAALLLAAADELELLRSLLKQSTLDFDPEHHRANENELAFERQRIKG
jgi:hypothetical protein